MAMNQGTEPKFMYFQAFRELGLPVYIKIDSNQFSIKVNEFLEDMGFSAVNDANGSKIEEDILKTANARLINMEKASPLIIRQMSALPSNEHFGDETITPKNGYRIYRYKKFALSLYAYSAKEWTFGVMHDFQDENHWEIYKISLGRILSLALSPLGIIGFWGVPVDDGIVVQKQTESKGELVFLDIQNKYMLTRDGITPIAEMFQIIRLVKTQNNQSRKMKIEEYISFLTHHCSFFDYGGLSLPIRQMIKEITRTSKGVYLPEKGFKPRTDLSL